MRSASSIVVDTNEPTVVPLHRHLFRNEREDVQLVHQESPSILEEVLATITMRNHHGVDCPSSPLLEINVTLSVRCLGRI